MTNATQFSLANRKQLAELLGDNYDSLRRRTRDKFTAKRVALRETIIKEFADKKGANAVARQITAAREKVQDLRADLAKLGFDLDSDGDLSLHDEHSNLMAKTIDTRVTKEIGSWPDIEARFDSAQVAMMTVASLEDAEKLLKSVQEI